MYRLEYHIPEQLSRNRYTSPEASLTAALENGNWQTRGAAAPLPPKEASNHHDHRNESTVDGHKPAQAWKSFQ